MNIIIIVVAVTAGGILGGTAIYVYQEKCRQKEIKRPSARCSAADGYCERKRSGKQKQGKRHYMQDWNPDW